MYVESIYVYFFDISQQLSNKGKMRYLCRSPDAYWIALVGLWCGARREFIFMEELELWPPCDSIKHLQDSADACNRLMSRPTTTLYQVDI